MELLQRCLEKNTIPFLADKINVNVGTVKRWIQLQNVPQAYTFDLLKILNVPIHYPDYPDSLKDQFFTPVEVAELCWETFKTIVTDYHDYTFIEPSAGNGNFLKVLPSSTLAFDIEPKAENIQQQDYLLWKPPPGKFIVFGNPPFGLRGHVALQFINHSYEFADYVCFILPQLFESDGKGSPRKRVHYNLIYTEPMTVDFNLKEKTQKINVVFQIWSKNKTKTEPQQPKNENVKVYSLSDGGTPGSTRNKKMLNSCDIYLPSTCYGEHTMRIYNSFEELPGRKGYGVVFSKDKTKLLEKAKNIDWGTVSFLSTNSAYNLRSSMILKQFNLS